MAENYVVNYSINVNAEKATQALTAFQTASASLTTTFEALKGFETTINSVVGSLQKLSKTKATLSINTEVAKKKLDTIITRLEKINRLASKGATLNTAVSTNNAKGAPATSSAKAATVTSAKVSSKKAAATTSTNSTPITTLPVKSSVPSARVVADKVWADMFAAKWRPAGVFAKNGAASMPSVVPSKVSSKAESTASSSAWPKAFNARAIAGRMWADTFTNKSWTYPAGSFVKTDSTFVPKPKLSVAGSQKVQKAGNATSGFNISSKSISSSEAKINKLASSLNALFDKRYTLQVGGITQVEQGLSRVIAKLQTIETLASKAKLTTRSTSNSGNTKKSGGTTIVAGSKAQTPLVRPTTKGGIPLIRNTENIGYKTLGPTPLPSNGGIAVDMLKGMGIAYGISGIGQAISSIVEQSTGYDNTMKTVENILKSHDTSEDFSGRFQAMGRLVRNVGMETKFTVTQVADAAKFLAMAGLDVDAIQKSIRPIADIALVGDTDLGETADLVTNVMTAYNIAPAKMRQAADVMTNTFTMSNTTLSEIAESYKYAASILSAGGVGFEEATAAIGVLGDAGIKGSQAGTTMRTIMANIVNPTKKQAKAWKAVGVSTKDKNGQAKSLLEIFQELNEKNLNVADYYKLFHKTAASGAIALADHVDKWNNVYLENLTSGGISSKLADEKKNTLQGKWAQLTSTFTDTGVTAFQGVQGNLQMWMDQAINWLKSDKAVQIFKDVANTMIEFIQTLIEATKWFKRLYDVFSPVIKLWVKFQLVIWPVVKGIQAFKSVWLGLKGFGAIGSSIGSITRSMLGLAEASREAAVAGSMVGRAPVVSAASRESLRFLGDNKYMRNIRKHLNSTPFAFAKGFALTGKYTLWDYPKMRVKSAYRNAATGLLGQQAYLVPGSNEAINRLSDKRQRWRDFRRNAALNAKQWDNLATLPSNTPEDVEYARQQQTAYLNAVRRADARINRLQDGGVRRSWWGDIKEHYKQNIKPQLTGAAYGVGGMAAGAAGSYMMMDQMTKEHANNWNYVSGGLYGLAGMAAMAGGPVGIGVAAVAGLLGYATQLASEASRANEIFHEIDQFISSHRLIDGVLVDSDSKTMQYMEFVWRKEYDINELIERRAQLYREMYGLDIPEKTTNKDVGTSIFNERMKGFDEVNHWYDKSDLIDSAINLFDSYGAQYGLTVGKNPISRRFGVTLPNGEFIPYSTTDSAQETAAYDVAAAVEMIDGGYYTKIVEEYQKKIAQGLYSKGMTAEGMAKIKESLNSNYNPANIQGLVKPDQYDVSWGDAMKWTGDDVAKSYLGNMLVWLALENVRKGQQAVQNFKEKLAAGTLVESDVVNALKFGDNNGLGLHLANYNPNDIGSWFESFGYQNGQWVTGDDGKTPEFQAQGAAASMQQLLDSIKRLGLEASPATEQLRTYAETLLTLAQSYMNAGQGITGSKDGETRTVNGQTWRWNAANKVWELDDKDNSLGEMTQGLMAFSESIQAVKTSLGLPMPNSIFGTPTLGYTPGQSGIPGNGGAGMSGSSWGLGALNTPWGQYGSTSGRGNKTAGAKKDKPKVTVATLPTAVTTANGQPGLGSGGDSNKNRNTPKASDYKNHYNKGNAAPKQVIVRIGNLMNVDKIDLSNPNNAAVVANLKSELAQALVDVVHDFDETWHG